MRGGGGEREREREMVVVCDTQHLFDADMKFAYISREQNEGTSLVLKASDKITRSLTTQRRVYVVKINTS